METVITQMVGRKLESVFQKENIEIGEKMLEVKGLTNEGKFDNVSFDVSAGEIVGFSGLMGAGRTEVMRSLFGLDPHQAGEIIIRNRKTEIKSVKAALAGKWSCFRRTEGGSGSYRSEASGRMFPWRA
jgi:inositol transport system ATP-binding protein